MNSTKVALACSLSCLGSFVWGMLFHFRRVGQPTKSMLLTAFLAINSGVLQLWGIVHRPPWLTLVAITMYVTSLVIFWWATAVTKDKLAACGQDCVSRAVLQQGPYRWIRHPFYAAYNLTWLAAVAVSRWWPLALSAVVMAVLYERFAREEERSLLLGPSGGDYRCYAKRTGRYLPLLRARQ